MSDISIPLAERLRPKSLTEYSGQTHLLGKSGPIKRALDSNIIPSMILWGPPGVGKTTLAYLIAKKLDRPFYNLSAISSGVKDVREIITQAQKTGGLFEKKKPLLFIDEIHRFSKTQQDSVLGAVEKGTINLIGATTENPSFEVISALLSRCQVYNLHEHEKKDLEQLLINACAADVFLKKFNINIKEPDYLIGLSGGDARKLLNILEIIVSSFKEGEKIQITNSLTKELASESIARYDKNGEQHYDIISAFIKSIRGSDPNAAIYWLARMVEGGEDPLFIARRLIILASEDIGLANPNALLLANSCFQSVQVIGWPESRIILSQCVIYLSHSEKSNMAYKAINKAQDFLRKNGDHPVPLALRNAPTKLMKDLNYGSGYLYSHDYPNHFIAQEFLPEEIKGTSFIKASDNKKEREIKDKIDKNWKGKYK